MWIRIRSDPLLRLPESGSVTFQRGSGSGSGYPTCNSGYIRLFFQEILDKSEILIGGLLLL